MMVYPSIDSLMKKFDSKYRLVVAAAKRARELTENEVKGNKGKKSVTTALEELENGIISYQRYTDEQKA